MAIPTQFISDLLGAPMRAIVQAEALAARATADFIKEVGFTGNSDAADPDFGSVRNITFRYQRFDATGAAQTVTLEIPLLTLVPIPAIQVAEAEVSFDMALTLPTANNNAAPGKNFFSREPVRLKGIIAPRSKGMAPTGTAPAGNANMSVRIKMQQADMTLGMVQLINLLDNAKNEKP